MPNEVRRVEKYLSPPHGIMAHTELFEINSQTRQSMESYIIDKEQYYDPMVAGGCIGCGRSCSVGCSSSCSGSCSSGCKGSCYMGKKGM